MIVYGTLITDHIQRLFKTNPVPNRRFFACPDHNITELKKNKELHLNINSSRVRDTFGTNMTLLGVDKTFNRYSHGAYVKGRLPFCVKFCPLYT